MGRSYLVIRQHFQTGGEPLDEGLVVFWASRFLCPIYQLHQADRTHTKLTVVALARISTCSGLFLMVKMQMLMSNMYFNIRTPRAPATQADHVRS